MENEALSIIQWFLSNPEKVALGLVMIAGAARWLHELRVESREDENRETFLQTLIRENKELRDELRERRKIDKRNGKDDNSGRPSS